MSSQPTTLRPVGNLERFSTARHSLGYYRCIGVTARYRTKLAPGNLSSIIETAVAQVVLRHPSLCCGIINEDKTDPSFVRLERIDLSKRIAYRSPDDKTLKNNDDALLEIVAHQHGQLWPNLNVEPGWKVIIVQNTSSTPAETVFDAMFAFHHAPTDGLSGMVFHRSFLEALNNPKIIDLTNHILRLPESIVLPPALEKVVDFKISWPFFLAKVWNEFGPKWLLPVSSPPWTGPPCASFSIENYQSRAKLIIISPENFSKILIFCREKKLTLTGLLHGLIVVSLTFHVPSAMSFSSVTPYSLRHLTGLHPTKEMGNNVSGLSSTYSVESISAIRACKSTAQLLQEVCTIAANFSIKMKAEISSLPNDNIVGMVPYVSNLHKMFISRLGKPRSDTYEISNLGSLKNEKSEQTWAIDRLFFTQSGMVTGPAMSFNVASVADGLLTISITWLQDEIDEVLAEKVTQYLESSLNDIAEEKTLGIFNESAI